tara:strand:+ start:8234 stop:10171 length:1938 start_codon:yes stop_codon:yes gene_type:complete
MITFVRRIIGSKFGAVFALLFLGLIAFAFAAGDVGNLGNFGSMGGGSSTKIGSQSLPESELQSRAQRVFEQQRSENPGMKISDFLELNAVPQIYNQLVAGIALSEFAKRQGIHVSKRMVDAKIAAIPAFQDAAGKFSQSIFREMLSRTGVSEKALRDDIEKELIAEMLLGPASFGARLPDSLVLPYASLLLEAREGHIAAVPSAVFKPAGPPSDKQLADFYKKNADRYTIPERRSMRYAIVDADRFAAAAMPTEAEIKAYYDKNKARYAAKETRTIEQLILPTENAAKAAVNAASLDAAARANGLSVGTFGQTSKADFAKAASAGAADAAFAAPEGKTVGPVELELGWAVLRVTGIQKTAEQPIDAVKPEIVEMLKADKHQRLLADFISKIEDDVANGSTFDEVVKDNALTVETTPSLLATGQNVDDPVYRPTADVGPLLKPAFEMEGDDDAQFVPITQQQRYALLDVTNITPPAPPPLEKVKAIIVQHYQLHEGATKARALADKLKGEIDKGTPLDKALAGAGIPLPPAQKVAGRRADLLRDDKRPPAEISILFAMAQGSVKIMPIPNDQGYFIIMLDKIEQGDAAKVPGLVDKVRSDITTVVANEYGAQFERAVERELDVKHNPAAIAGATQELRRINGAAAQ